MWALAAKHQHLFFFYVPSAAQTIQFHSISLFTFEGRYVIQNPGGKKKRLNTFELCNGPYSAWTGMKMVFHFFFFFNTTQGLTKVVFTLDGPVGSYDLGFSWSTFTFTLH